MFRGFLGSFLGQGPRSLVAWVLGERVGEALEEDKDVDDDDEDEQHGEHHHPRHTAADCQAVACLAGLGHQDFILIFVTELMAGQGAVPAQEQDPEDDQSKLSISYVEQSQLSIQVN